MDPFGEGWRVRQGRASTSGLGDRLFKGRTPQCPLMLIQEMREVGQDTFIFVS